MNTCFYILPKAGTVENHSQQLATSAYSHLGIDTGRIQKGRILEFQAKLNAEEINFVRNYLVDTVAHSIYLENEFVKPKGGHVGIVSKKPGITDDESRCAEKTFEDRFNRTAPKVRTHELYLIENKISEEELAKIANTLLGNPLIHDFGWDKFQQTTHRQTTEVNKAIPEFAEIWEHVSRTEHGLVHFSLERQLALNLAEMQTITNHFQKLQRSPTDCELEILAQTWSEHCKHKEFNAHISFKDLDSGETRIIDSLFQTKIKKATDLIDMEFKKRGNSFLVKVFNDNAGIVRVDEDTLFVWKVETHNTPSALDPHGGAMTGVLGVNRDAFGTGIGGARLLFNTNVLCFGSPNYNKKLLKGQKHPLYIRDGVVRGVKDAGNQSGVPTVNGSIIYDDRYSGKPLVFCGTGALLPARYGSRDASLKPVAPGDCILSVGGRVGKDGIHGATASSTYTDERTPTTIVQLGSPVTQKFLSDFLEHVCRLDLVKSCTDNGAGGLSSSIGELADLAGGAVVQLEKIPLKYPGLQPWEIFVSESQERMTLVCEAKNIAALLQIAEEFEVEASVIGSFTNTGFLDVRFEDKPIAYLDLEFLHNGLPQKHLEAEWKKPVLHEPVLQTFEAYNESLLNLLSSENICSRRPIIRQYDHEVKGRTIIKPLMGQRQNAPQDAGVLRLNFTDYRGLAVSNGIIPRYGDIDPYQMAAGSFDEAVRQIIAVGGRLPDPEEEKPNFWSVNDNFCTPDIVYDPLKNPDGKLKLAKLVRMCDALFDMSTFFKIPMTSGKDSMKNDFGSGKERISVPPTVLFSMVAGIPDVRKTLTTEWKTPGSLVYLVGKTYDELGASEFYKLFGHLGAHVPIVRPDDAKRIYQKFALAHDTELLESAHDLSDGGLGVALAEACIGSDLGAELSIDLDSLSPHAYLFAESHSRFIVSVKAKDKAYFEHILGADASLLGSVTAEPYLVCQTQDRTLIHCSIAQMSRAWEGAESWYA